MNSFSTEATPHLRYYLLHLIFVAMVTICPLDVAKAEQRCAATIGVIVETNGQLELLKAQGSTRSWIPIKINTTLCPNDTLRVGPLSSALVLLHDEAGGTYLAAKERTTISFSDSKAKRSVVIDTGRAHFLSRISNSMEVITPFLNAGIEGTEFSAVAMPDISKVSVVEGKVRVNNTIGEALLLDGMTATASANSPPLVTFTLRPLNEVAWSVTLPTLFIPEMLTSPEASGGSGDPQRLIEAQQVYVSRGADALFDLLTKYVGDKNYAQGTPPILKVIYASMLLERGQINAAQLALDSTLACIPHTQPAAEADNVESIDKEIDFSAQRNAATPARKNQFFTNTFNVLRPLATVEYGGCRLDANEFARGYEHALRSIIALNQNNPSLALAEGIKANSIAPNQAISILALSNAYQASYNLQAALQVLTTARSNGIHHPILLAKEAELLFANNDYKSARAVVLHAHKLEPKSSYVSATMAMILLADNSAGSRKNARKLLAAALEHTPNNIDLLIGQALLFIREGELLQGRSHLEKAVALAPTHSLLRSYLGKAYYEEGRYKEAEAQFKIAAELDPADPTPWMYAAISKYATNDPIGAWESFLLFSSET